MKINILAIVSTLVFTGTIFASVAHAEDAHHPEAKTSTTASPTPDMSDKGGMMEKMDMGQMHSMMNECMQTHKDGKMCNHDMMDKCQAKMGKDECQKMMKDMKKEPKKK